MILASIRRELEVRTEAGRFLDRRPVAYQLKNGQKIEVSIDYLIYDRQTDASGLVSLIYGFKVEDYDRTLPLVIDRLFLSTADTWGARPMTGSGCGR
jgi:hypothetical protein